MTRATILPATAHERRILNDGTFQARDAGLYPTLDGRLVRGGVLFRSDALSALSPDDSAQLVDIGVKLVVDLREEVEANAAPDTLPSGVDYLRVPLFEETLFQIDVATFPTLLGQYSLLLDHHMPRIVEAITAVAAAQGAPVIVHCTAGKDRTGLVVALIQLLLGVDETVVLEDYGASQTLLGPHWDGAVRQFYSRAGLPEAILGSNPTEAPPSHLTAVLDEIHRRYPSVEDFLVDHGMRLHHIETLRSSLLEASPHAQFSATASTHPAPITEVRTEGKAC